MTEAEKADFDEKYNIINEATPRHAVMTGRYRKSFAYFTLRSRLPVILTTVIDDLTKDKDEIAAKRGEVCREEIKAVIGKLSKLKYELQTDKELQLLQDDEPDRDVWNRFVNQLSPSGSSFFKTCWLYAECYMYRAIWSYFQCTSYLKNHDYFSKQKTNAVKLAHNSIDEVLQDTRHLARSMEVLVQLLKLNLWGNQYDLSMSNGMEMRPEDKLFTKAKEPNENLIVDNSENVWRCLVQLDRTKPIVVDIICDNTGYELFTDFVVADYLIEKNLAQKIRFHVKAIPWFISDVTEADFRFFLSYLQEQESRFMKDAGHKWTKQLQDGTFVLVATEHFWTSPHEYFKMEHVSPSLYQDLMNSSLILFKGDLNYRKLLGDFGWDYSEEFITCLRGFRPSNLCTLRIVKADLICGLPEGLAQKLSLKNTNWMVSGEYGVIQFAEKKSCGCSKQKP